MKITQSDSDVKFNLSKYLKISLLITALSFFVYSLYWTVYSFYWVYNVTVNITASFGMLSIISPMQQTAIIIQEYASSAGYFFGFVGSIFAVQCTVLFIKTNEKYVDKLAKTFLFSALFFVMLIPSSIQHFLGVVFSWPLVDIYVGFSFMLQALLIAIPLIFLSYSMRKPGHQTSILKHLAIGITAVAFGFWVKYLFLFLYALSPLGPKHASFVGVMGLVNSFVTLLIAGVVTSIACLVLYRRKKVNTGLVGLGLVLFGSFFIIYDLVSIWVPIYGSFLYLTDFWMVVLPILGIIVLRIQSFRILK